MVGAIAGGVTAVAGIAQSIAGFSKARKYRKMLENYDRQELQNSYDGMKVSTVGTDRQLREGARTAGSSIDAIMRGGVRALGNVGRVQMANQQLNAGVTQNIERQQFQIGLYKAQDQSRIRGMQEARENSDLQGLAAQQQNGEQMGWAGINTVAGAASSVAGMNSAPGGSSAGGGGFPGFDMGSIPQGTGFTPGMIGGISQ